MTSTDTSPTTPSSSTSTAPAFEHANARDISRTFLRVGALHELQYRVNFWLQLVQSVVALGTAIAVIALVFQYTTELGGWTENQLLVILGVHVLLGGVIQAVIQPNMQQLMADIREGTLDFVLTKPADAQLLVSLRKFQFWKLVDVVVGLGVIIVGTVRQDAAVGVADIAAFVLTLLLGMVLVYCFWLIITVGAFWLVNMDFVGELFNGLYQAGRWPVTIYPTWLRTSFTILVPLAFAVTVPAQALTGRLSGIGLTVAIGFTIVVTIATRLFWNVGLSHYHGASA